MATATAGICIGFVVLLVMAVANDSGVLFIFAISVAILSAVALRRVMLPRNRNRVRRALADRADVPLESLAGTVLTVSRDVNQWEGLRLFVSYLAKDGDVGHAFRFSLPEARGPVNPIVVPFEPLPLDETDVAVQEVAGHSTADVALPTVSLPCPSDTRRSVYRSRIRRHVRRSGGRMLAVWSLLSVFIAPCQILVGVRRGYWHGIEIALLLLACIGIVAVILTWRHSREWFVVPGGLVLRQARWLRSNWQLSVFAQANSVLCVFPTGRERWQMLVADARNVHATVVTRFEAEFALRAWLSPLPPPSPDQLTDLH